jgi:hypothetical protein
VNILTVSFTGVESAGIRKLIAVVGDQFKAWELSEGEACRLIALGAPTPAVPFAVTEREADLRDIFRLLSQTSFDEYELAGLTQKQADALVSLVTEMEDAFGFDPLTPYESIR